MTQNACRFLLVFIVLGCTFCTSVEEDYVAKWDDTKISTAEFKTQYVNYSSVAPLRDSFDQRKQYARSLIERKAIANMAESFNYDTDPTVANSIKRARELSAIKHFVRSEVSPLIPEITEREVYAAFLRKNSSVFLEQIYAPTQSQIEAYYQELISDSANFEAMAAESMVKANEQPDQYKMGWVEWNMMDLEPEITAFDLEINEFSKPIQSLSGWHIFRATNKQETFYADQTTFQNARELTKQELYRRKFEEQSIRYINSVLEQTPIEFYSLKINQFWEYLSPQLPSDKQSLVAYLNSGDNFSEQFQESENHILAKVDGRQISAKDFLDRLPSIPYWQLKANLRPAIETVAKDLVFAQKAEDAGFFEHPNVQKDAEIERVRSLYNYFTADVSDTLNLPRFEDNWFETHRNRYISDIQITFKTYTFEDESSARSLLEEYQVERNWEPVLASRSNFTESDPIQISRAEFSDHPVFTIQFRPSKSDSKLQLWGPYQSENGWSFIEILNRDEIYFAKDQVQERIQSDMKANRVSITHHYLLDELGFEPSEINYDSLQLSNVLPFHFEQ